MSSKLLALLLTGVVATSATALDHDVVGKDGATIGISDGQAGEVSSRRADFEYNTAGSIDAAATTAGSALGWGEWFITTVHNDTGQDIVLTELGFPCGGTVATDDHGWVVWTGLAGLEAPAGDAFTADYSGAYTPASSDDVTSPPPTYTYVDLIAASITVAAGDYFCVGYKNPGIGGQIDNNGVDTWAWYSEVWDPDVNYGRTAVIQVKADYAGSTPTQETSWSAIKSLY
jgi:hypothetical protein